MPRGKANTKSSKKEIPTPSEDTPKKRTVTASEETDEKTSNKEIDNATKKRKIAPPVEEDTKTVRRSTRGKRIQEAARKATKENESDIVNVPPKQTEQPIIKPSASKKKTSTKSVEPAKKISEVVSVQEKMIESPPPKPRVIVTAPNPTFQTPVAPTTAMDITPITSPQNAVLTLPSKYKDLDKMFKALEMSCAFLERRDQFCTFEKIQQAIQESCKRNFTRTHLAQIKALYPEAYIIECGRNNALLVARIRTTEPHKKGHWTEAEMTDRKKEFKKRILQQVKNFHSQFLAANSIAEDDTLGIQCWHDDFDLESLPDIEQAPLGSPLPKILKTNKPKTSVSSELSKMVIEKSTPLKAELSKLNPETILKVRAREQKQKEEDTPEYKEALHRRSLMAKLPILSEKIRSFFSVENKTVMPFPYLLSKLVVSFQGKYSAVEVTEHVNFLVTVLPEWASLISYPDGTTVLKINRKFNLQEAKERFNLQKLN